MDSKLSYCKKYPHLLLCIMLAAACSLLSFIYFYIVNDGFFTLTADFDVQQLPFSIALHKHILDNAGNLGGWVWSYELGHSLIQAFSFSAIGSPFFWLSMLFPADSFPYIVMWIYCLKYIAAAVFSYFYFMRFVRDDRSAVLGAMLYAFSGFQTVNIIFYSFHDVVALFPLLLIGLEKLMADSNCKCFFIFAVFLNCLLNYYFFVQEVVFLIIYFLCRFWSRDLSLLLRRVGACLFCGIFGVCMAAVIFLPNALYMLSSPRMDSGSLDKFALSLREMLHALKGMLLPAESMQDTSSVIQEDYLSACCSMSLVGLIPLIAYTMKNRDWLARILLICVIASLIPLLGSVFLLFTELYYRWWFMFTLMMALAACLVFEQPQEYRIRTGALINTALVAFLFVVLLLAERISGGYIFSIKRLLLLCFVTVSGLLFTLFVSTRMKQSLTCLAICAALFSVASGLSVVYTYKLYTVPGGEDVKADISLGSKLEVIDPQYRYDNANNILGLVGEASAMDMFSSTRSNGSMEFDALFDYFLGFRSLDKHSIPGLTNLLGGRFYISTETDGSHLRHYQHRGHDYYVMAQEASPIGFSIDKYVLRSDFDETVMGRRGVLLMQAAVIAPADEAAVEGFASRVSAFDSSIDLGADPDELSRIHQHSAVQDFSRDSRGFRCTSHFEEDCLVYFSVPFDSGWKAFVDAEQVNIIDSGGMMLLPISSGAHEIEFTYITPGYRTGLVVSAISIAAFVIFCILQKKRRS